MSNECDIIYECKTCRNIFRSLANFISHKRVYCKTKFNVLHHFNFRPDNNSIDQDLSTIIQKDQDYRHNVTTIISGNNKNPVKDLSSVIDRLLRKRQVTCTQKLSDYYEAATQVVAEQKEEQKYHTIQLEKVNEMDESKCVAVYQTVTQNASSPVIVTDDKITNNDSIKEEVLEVHHLKQNNTVVLGEDGKAVIKNEALNIIADDMLQTLDIENVPNKISCNICK